MTTQNLEQKTKQVPIEQIKFKDKHYDFRLGTTLVDISESLNYKINDLGIGTYNEITKNLDDIRYDPVNISLGKEIISSFGIYEINKGASHHHERGVGGTGSHREFFYEKKDNEQIKLINYEINSEWTSGGDDFFDLGGSVNFNIDIYQAALDSKDPLIIKTIEKVRKLN